MRFFLTKLYILKDEILIDKSQKKKHSAFGGENKNVKQKHKKPHEKANPRTYNKKV